MSKNVKKAKTKTPPEERRPMHLRLSPDERRQLDRVAARLGLSPSATLRFLVNAEDQRHPPAPSLKMIAAFTPLFRDDD